MDVIFAKKKREKSDIRVFGRYLAVKIRPRIRLAVHFSANFQRTKIGGNFGLGLKETYRILFSGNGTCNCIRAYWLAEA